MTNIELLVMIKHGVKIPPRYTAECLTMVQQGLCDYHNDLDNEPGLLWEITERGVAHVDSILNWIEMQPYDGEA